MYFISGRSFIITAVAAGLALSSLQANAQQVKFHLPVEAHWGGAVLQPGDYSLSTPVAEVAPILRISGNSSSSMVLPKLTEIKPISDRSFLQLVNVNGEYFVKEYKSGFTGKVFEFGVPKPVAETTISSAATTYIAVEEGTK